MPRSGWLAVGVVLAALAIPAIGVGRSWAVTAAVGALLLILLLLRIPIPARAGVVAAAVGALLVAVRLAVAPVGATTTSAPEGRGPWTMLVETVGAPREGRQVATLRLVNTGNARDTGTTALTTAVTRLAATLPRYPPLEPGDRVEVTGRTRERPDTPYGRYLERIGAWGSLQADTLAVLPGPDGPARRLEGLRRDAGEALTVVLPEPEAGLAAGILIGLRDRVDRDVAAAFTTAGVSHVVAISGWNIAIVAAAIGAVAGKVGRRRRAIVTALAIAAYIAFAGASPSVLRAGAMAGVVLIARESGRAGRAAAALGWAAVILLVADPSLVGDAGFQLSTLATAGLIAWATPTTAWIGRLTRGRLPRWLVESLGVSLAAQVATTPVVLASFGRIALIAPGINLLVVPLVAPVMAAGIVAMAGGMLVGLGAPGVIGSVLAVPAWVGLRLMIALVGAAAGVPYASLEVEPPIGALLAVAVTAVIVVAALARRWRRPSTRQRTRPSEPTALANRATTSSASQAPRAAHAAGHRAAVLSLVVAVACTGAVAASRPPGVARLTVLDVGQGDAILLEGARGGRLLVDGGPDPDRLLVELDRRIPPWDRRIDVVILSHPHEDHVAGLALLLARYDVGRVLEPGMLGPGPGYDAWQATLERVGAPRRGTLAAGDRLVVDDVRLDVRWPIRGSVPLRPANGGTGINNVSVVLLGSVGDRRFLLSGDVEDGVDPSLLASGLPPLDILKVAHHGSRTATTEAFLAAVRPRVAIASAGTGNPYGHPAKRTLERLAASGARVYRTDVDGTVTVTFEAGGPTIRRQPRPSLGRVTLPTAPVAGGPGTATPRGVSAVARRLPAFLCAIPGFGTPSAAPRPAEPPGASALAAAAPTPEPGAAGEGTAESVGYHRGDDGPDPDRGGCPAAFPGSPTLVPRARARRGRGGGLAGGAHRSARDRRGPASRGGRGPPARCRQDPARRRPGPRPAARRRLRGMVDGAGSPGTGAAGRGPPGDPPGRWRGPPALGRVRQSRGAHRGLRGQACRPTAGVDGGPVRLLAPPLSGRLGRCHVARRGGAGRAARSGRVSGGGHGPGRRSAPGLDRRRPAHRSPRSTPRPRRVRMIASLLYVWGDDDLVAERLVTRFGTALAGELGTPLERWDVRVDQANATVVAGQLHERLATAVLFGGGTLAVVANPGALVRRNDNRDRVAASISLGVARQAAYSWYRVLNVRNWMPVIA